MASDPDPERPRLHVTPRHGWLNDPNGLIQREGRTHLFFQHDPSDAQWGPPSWAHVSSDDLVTWRAHPIALEPATASGDAGGCWSGTAVDADGTPTIFYTGVQNDVQRVFRATSSDGLDAWAKDPNNPLLEPPEGLGVATDGFRDPYVWRDERGWSMLVGASLDGLGNAVLYRSSDLEDWTCLGPLLDPEVRAAWPDPSHTWECPNLFRLEDAWVLIVSHATPKALERPSAFIGDFDGRRFVPRRRHAIDAGFHGFYAPLTMEGPGGRRLMWGWLQEQRSAEAQRAAGWSGAQSFPRELTLRNGRVHQAFVPELAALRSGGWSFVDLDVARRLPLDTVTGHQLELRLDLERGDADASTLELEHGPGVTTKIVVDWTEGAVELHVPGTSADASLRWSHHVARCLEHAAQASLHVMLDRSVLEVLADGQSISARPYARRRGPGRVSLSSAGGTCRVRRLEAWRLG